jgi:signal peptidase I
MPQFKLLIKGTGVTFCMIMLNKFILPSADMFPLIEQFIEDSLRVCFTVSGNSMWPLIRNNIDSVLLVRPGEPVHIGDIVLIRYSGVPAGYILHRLYHIDESTCTTIGDNCVTLDESVPLDSIIGQVESVYRGTRTIRCGAIGWRLLFHCWIVLYPFRKQLLRLLYVISRIKYKIHQFVRRETR